MLRLTTSTVNVDEQFGPADVVTIKWFFLWDLNDKGLITHTAYNRLFEKMMLVPERVLKLWEDMKFPEPAVISPGIYYIDLDVPFKWIIEYDIVFCDGETMHCQDIFLKEGPAKRGLKSWDYAVSTGSVTNIVMNKIEIKNETMIK